MNRFRDHNRTHGDDFELTHLMDLAIAWPIRREKICLSKRLERFLYSNFYFRTAVFGEYGGEMSVRYHAIFFKIAPATGDGTDRAGSGPCQKNARPAIFGAGRIGPGRTGSGQKKARQPAQFF